MTDFFALLDLPRRPWLDPDSIKQKFIALSAEFHPDRTHGNESQKRPAQDRYTQINGAYNCLRNPRERVSHLIKLERGPNASELQTVPADLMNVFMEVGNACRQADRFLGEKAAATSPLLKVQLFERGQEFSDQLAAIRAKLTAAREELITALKRLDADWEQNASSDASSRASLLDKLEEIRRLLGFYDRWISQVQERFVQLAL